MPIISESSGRMTWSSLRAIFPRENINIYLHFMSFLHTTKIHVVEIPPRVRQGPAYSTIISIMAADYLAMQGARASATTIVTYLNRVNSVPAR